jgi:PTS system cellobiose-specific IIB component
MRKIVLCCAAGMSTSLLVTRMENAAKAAGYECEIAAYPISDAPRVCPSADVVLLGPQVRFKLDSLKKEYPDKKIDCIPMQMYGMMDGAGVLKIARTLMGE